jgi:hypothetical protein
MLRAATHKMTQGPQQALHGNPEAERRMDADAEEQSKN